MECERADCSVVIARRALLASGLEHNVRMRDVGSGWDGVLKVMIDSGADGSGVGRRRAFGGMLGEDSGLGLKVMDPVERARYVSARPHHLRSRQGTELHNTVLRPCRLMLRITSHHARALADKELRPLRRMQSKVSSYALEFRELFRLVGPQISRILKTAAPASRTLTPRNPNLQSP